MGMELMSLDTRRYASHALDALRAPRQRLRYASRAPARPRAPLRSARYYAILRPCARRAFVLIFSARNTAHAHFCRWQRLVAALRARVRAVRASSARNIMVYGDIRRYAVTRKGAAQECCTPLLRSQNARAVRCRR